MSFIFVPLLIGALLVSSAGTTGLLSICLSVYLSVCLSVSVHPACGFSDFFSYSFIYLSETGYMALIWKLQNKFEFQGISSIFHRVMPF